MNNATCVAKYEDGDYQCACAVGFVGAHCEIGILDGFFFIFLLLMVSPDSKETLQYIPSIPS